MFIYCLELNFCCFGMFLGNMLDFSSRNLSLLDNIWKWLLLAFKVSKTKPNCKSYLWQMDFLFFYCLLVRIVLVHKNKEFFFLLLLLYLKLSGIELWLLKLKFGTLRAGHMAVGKKNKESNLNSSTKSPQKSSITWMHITFSGIKPINL